MPHPALVRLRNGLRGDSHHVRYSSSTLKHDGSRSTDRKAFRSSESGRCVFQERREIQVTSGRLWATSAKIC